MYSFSHWHSRYTVHRVLLRLDVWKKCLKSVIQISMHAWLYRSLNITTLYYFVFASLITCSTMFTTLSSLFNDLDQSTWCSLEINIQFINQNLMGYMSIDPNYIPLFNLHLEAVDFFNVQAAKFRHIESIFKGNLA